MLEEKDIQALAQLLYGPGGIPLFFHLGNLHGKIRDDSPKQLPSAGRARRQNPFHPIPLLYNLDTSPL